jgi:hypothetical protein
LLGEQWLMGIGLFCAKSIDTLLSFAFMEPSVESNGVTVSIDQDAEHNGAYPYVRYDVTLKPLKGKLYRAYKGKGSVGLGEKFKALVAVWLGAPVGVSERIKARAAEYLPANYGVVVRLNDPNP